VVSSVTGLGFRAIWNIFSVRCHAAILMLDAWTKISVFTKLKLRSCVRPDHRAGRFDLVAHMSAAPGLFRACCFEAAASSRG
jgi:hypothetical protein